MVEFVKKCNLEQVASLSEDQGSNILAVRSVQQVTQSCFFYIRSYALFCPFFEPWLKHDPKNFALSSKKRRVRWISSSIWGNYQNIAVKIFLSLLLKATLHRSNIEEFVNKFSLFLTWPSSASSAAFVVLKTIFSVFFSCKKGHKIVLEKFVLFELIFAMLQNFKLKNPARSEWEAADLVSIRVPIM